MKRISFLAIGALLVGCVDESATSSASSYMDEHKRTMESRRVVPDGCRLASDRQEALQELAMRLMEFTFGKDRTSDVFLSPAYLCGTEYRVSADLVHADVWQTQVWMLTVDTLSKEIAFNRLN